MTFKYVEKLLLTYLLFCFFVQKVSSQAFFRTQNRIVREFRLNTFLDYRLYNHIGN